MCKAQAWESFQEVEEVHTEKLNKIIAIIRKNVNSELEINESTDLRKELNIDSFDVLMIMNELDDEFGISLAEDDFKSVTTPGDIINLLADKYGI